MELKTKKRELPKIIKSKSKQEIRESGCCFRSCGGMPVVQQDNDPIKTLEVSSTKRLLSKIK